VTDRAIVVKFGGELLEPGAPLAGVVDVIARVAPQRPLVVVHGGGKEIDAALHAAGIEKRQIDGLRVTDGATLDVVVAVLAGTVNTRVVAALSAAGVRAVGLTGADAALGLSDVAPPHQAVDGRLVDLGRVGIPSGKADAGLVMMLVEHRAVPVIATIGLAAVGARGSPAAGDRGHDARRPRRSRRDDQRARAGGCRAADRRRHGDGGDDRQAQGVSGRADARRRRRCDRGRPRSIRARRCCARSCSGEGDPARGCGRPGNSLIRGKPG
jgi:hypothetical protein